MSGFEQPSSAVIAAFGGAAPAVRIAGGRGTSWRAGPIVLKPVDRLLAELEWEATELSAVIVPDARILTPIRSRDGGFVVDGWMATPFVEARAFAGRWLDILAVGRRLNEALAGVARPPFLAGRRSLWDTADLAAWGENPDAFLAYPHVRALAELRRPISEPRQLIHGDLTGNALFDADGAAFVIDFTAYWRPAAYALAIVVADALVWEGAPVSLVEDARLGSCGGQLFVRALMARAIAELLQQPAASPSLLAYPYDQAIGVARTHLR